MAKNNIKIDLIEELEWGIKYCSVKGTKWFNRVSIPTKRKLEKGDILNVYRREEHCDIKYGCVYDGKSLESSLARTDKDIQNDSSLRKNIFPDGSYGYLEPIC